jgi:uncharacterized protein
MKFWDSSALVGLFVLESFSESVRLVARRDPVVTVWWGTKVECASAFSRLEREGRLDAAQVAEAMERMMCAAGDWTEVAPSEKLRESALRLLRVHNLRAGDALQLAAALSACEGYPAGMEFVCLDTRLNEAALREGFRVVSPAPAA